MRISRSGDLTRCEVLVGFADRYWKWYLSRALVEPSEGKPDGMQLENLLRRDRVLVLDSCADRGELFERLVETVGDVGPGRDALVRSLVSREEEGPTSTPEGVAFPHALMVDIEETALVAALVRGGIDFGNREHPLCDVVFCLFGDPSKPWEHVQLLARLARVSHGPGAIERFRACDDAGALYDAVVEEDRSHV